MPARDEHTSRLQRASGTEGPVESRTELWTLRWQALRDTVDSEWSAAREAFMTPGTEAFRKWLGWALYRIAARVNPEILD